MTEDENELARIPDLVDQLDEILGDEPEYIQYALLIGAVAKHVTDHYDDPKKIGKLLEGFLNRVLTTVDMTLRMKEFEERVTKVLLDPAITDRQRALVPLMQEWMKEFSSPAKAMATWAHMISDIAEKHNLGRH